jgi:hypothetical protein
LTMSPPPLPYLPILAHIDPYWCFNMGYDKLSCQYLQYNMDKYVQIWANIDQYSAFTFHFHACSLRLPFVYSHQCVHENYDIQALFLMNHDMQSLLFFWYYDLINTGAMISGKTAWQWARLLNYIYPYWHILTHIGVSMKFNLGCDKLSCQYLLYNMDKYGQIWANTDQLCHSTWSTMKYKLDPRRRPWALAAALTSLPRPGGESDLAEWLRWYQVTRISGQPQVWVVRPPDCDHCPNDLWKGPCQQYVSLGPLAANLNLKPEVMPGPASARLPGFVRSLGPFKWRLFAILICFSSIQVV